MRAERSGKEAEFGAAAGPGNLGPAAGGGAGVDAEPGDVRGGPPGWLKKVRGKLVKEKKKGKKEKKAPQAAVRS